MSFLKKHRYELLLLAIMVLAAFLRFYRLDYQSLWYDELYTMNEADPSLSWETFFNFYYKDEHPPLFFLLQRLMFTLFGYESYIARIIPATAGVLNIAAIYYLGKEILDKRLGLIAAALLCVNTFSIYFSQEARAYTFLCLFTTLSYLYFLRILKRYRKGDIVMFGICTALMLYAHYFSLTVVFAQLALIILFWINEKKEKKKLVISFFIAMLIALILYIPCFPFMLATSNIEKYWTPLLPPTFALNYYADFFGPYKPLYIFLFGLPLFYYFFVYRERKSFASIKANPLILSAVICTVTIALCFIVPYLRSVLVTPMLQNRYFIITIPFFLLIHAYAVLLIKDKLISAGILSLFIGLMLFNLLVNKKYYSAPLKEDMRSLTTYIAHHGRNYPIVNEKSAWNQLYYLKKNGYTGQLVLGEMNKTVDSLLYSSSSKYALDTFWMEGGYTDHPPTDQKIQELNTVYKKIKEQHFYSAWAQLWVRRR